VKPPVTAPSEAPPASGSAKGSASPPVAVADPPEPKHPVAPPPPVHKTQPSTPPPAAVKPPRPDRPAQAKPEPTPPPPARNTGGDSGGCDEVSCVLNNNEGPCCAKFVKKGQRPAGGNTGGAKPAGELPERLDRAMIADGIGKVRGQVMACGDRSSAKGTVKVSVKVGPDGRITEVSVKETPDPGLGNCVKNQVQKATFARTQGGGSFAYPYPF